MRLGAIVLVMSSLLVAERHATLGPVAVTVRTDADEISVGAPLALTIEVVAEPGVEVRVPTYLDKIGAFDVIDARTPPDIPDGDKRRWTHTYTLSTFAGDTTEIPAIEITFVNTASGTGAKETLSVGPVPIVVETLAGAFDEAVASAVEGAIEVPAPPWPWLRWIAFAAGGILLGGGLGVLLWWGLRQGGVAGGPEVAVVLPHVWALEQLDGLERDGLIEQEKHHEFFFRLSDIVRQYIERRFELSAPERTTEEFIREMRDDPRLNDAQQCLLTGFLMAADMVKFARHRPPRDESEEALATARAFVEETTPVATPAAPAEAVS